MSESVVHFNLGVDSRPGVIFLKSAKVDGVIDTIVFSVSTTEQHVAQCKNSSTQWV